MNLLIWIITGGLIGTVPSLFATGWVAAAFVAVGIIGSVAGGLIASRNSVDSSPTEWDEQGLNPAALGWAIVGAILLIVVLNWVM